MEKKKLYKTIVKIEVLSEQPLDDNTTLDDIYHETRDGDWSGYVDWESTNSEVVGMEAVNEVKKHGSDPAFFQMDDEGNEIEDEF